MWQGFPLRPEQASTIAQGIDHLYYFLTAIDLFFTFVIFVTIFFFAVKYRRRPGHEKATAVKTHMALELGWTIVPTILCVIIFVWSSSLFIRNSRPPTASSEIFVVGKQWMWKLQHPEGKREIDELHIPVGQPIKLTMTSEDVIHDFFIPAFRVKKDVIPGTYTSIWFTATQTGKFHFFCAQYCGTDHSHMTGWVYVMTPSDYERWLSGGPRTETMAEAGAKLYEQYACATCHGTGKAPPFINLYNSTVKLQDGSSVVADDAYLRESILFPSEKIVAGYPAIMPTFKGQINEEQLLQLIAYIKSLHTEEGAK